MRIFDSPNHADSPVHRLPAGLKLAGALLMVLMVVSLPAWICAGVAGVLTTISVLSRLSWKYLCKRLLLLAPFVVSVALVGRGWLVFLTMVARSGLSMWTILLLASTTQFADLLRVLRRAHVPTLLVTTLALMHRYLFVLVDETERMNRARHSRTFTRQRWRVWKTLASVIGQLFVRSTERAERIYAAMCARGWK